VYYEEVLICKVRPEIITKYQRMPEEHTRNLKKTFQERYDDIANFEQYAHNNGTRVLKFFLHVSADEQRDRFLERIDNPEKNWKFSSADLKERGLWKKYMKAYEDCIFRRCRPTKKHGLPKRARCLRAELKHYRTGCVTSPCKDCAPDTCCGSDSRP